MKTLNIVKHWKKSLCLYCLLTLISIAVIAVKNFNTSIEFSGGTLLEIASSSIDNIENIFPNAHVSGFNGHYFVKLQNSDFHIEELAQNNNINILSSSVVAPQITGKLISTSIWAVIFSMIAMFVYIVLRFNIYYSIGAILTIASDVCLVLMFINVMNIEFGISSIAAILTLVGYSINDTVIIYDRIRQKLSHKNDFLATLNSAINSTFSRTIGTSLTTMIAILPIVLLADGSIQSFCLIICVGIFIGTMSSIFLSSFVLILFQKQIVYILQKLITHHS